MQIKRDGRRARKPSGKPANGRTPPATPEPYLRLPVQLTGITMISAKSGGGWRIVFEAGDKDAASVQTLIGERDQFFHLVLVRIGKKEANPVPP